MVWWEIKEGDRGFHFFPDKKKKQTIDLGKKNREIETSDDFVDSRIRYVRIVLKSPFTKISLHKEINEPFSGLIYLRTARWYRSEEGFWEDPIPLWHASQIRSVGWHSKEIF